MNELLIREARRPRPQTVRLFEDRVEVDPIGPAGVSVLAIMHNRHFGFDAKFPTKMGETRK